VHKNISFIIYLIVHSYARFPIHSAYQEEVILYTRGLQIVGRDPNLGHETFILGHEKIGIYILILPFSLDRTIAII